MVLILAEEDIPWRFVALASKLLAAFANEYFRNILYPQVPFLHLSGYLRQVRQILILAFFRAASRSPGDMAKNSGHPPKSWECPSRIQGYLKYFLSDALCFRDVLLFLV